MQTVAQSRIFVDLDGVRRAAEKNLREAFNRYTAFLDSGVGDLVREVEEALRLARSGDNTAIVTLNVPRSSARDILEVLVADLRDEFVSNTQYGLDGYLSQRIRHGTLQGHLRSPLEAANLITAQEADSPKYRPNEYWAQRVLTSNEKMRGKVADRLAQFSLEIDKLIRTVRTEWIQIRRTDEENGLFDFRIGPAVIPVVSSELSLDLNFHVLVETVLSMLMNQLSENLKAVRGKLGGELKDVMTGSLEKLHKDIEEMTHGADASELLGAIVAVQTGTQRAIDRMSEWFCVPAQSSEHRLPLRLAVEVAAETTRKFHANYDLQVRCQNSTNPTYPLPYWVSFVDVFLILFDNVVKHCGCANRADVGVEIWSDSGLIKIRAENSIDKMVATPEAALHLEKIKRESEQGEFEKFIRCEGKSGFHKIRKIIGQDFKSLRSFDFGFEGESKFFVEIAMTKELTDESTSS